MDLELTGKVALVTGAGQGTGRGIASLLAAEGVKVAVNDYFGDRADAVAKDIEAVGGIACSVQADVRDLEQVREMASAVSRDLGPVDILVNNAGVPIVLRTGEAKRTVFVESDLPFWKQQIDLNVYGCLNCTHAVLGSMIERRQGNIISIISDAARIGEAYMAVYSAAKAGVLAFSKSLAKEVGKHRINVNCIALGATAHEGIRNLLNPDATPEDDELLKKMLRAYPIGRGLGRIGRVSDAGYAVAFLASPKACFITGQCVSVNGGFAMV